MVLNSVRNNIQIICFLIHLQEQLLDALEAINVHSLWKDFLLVVEDLTGEQFTNHFCVGAAPLLIANYLVEPVEK